MSAAWQITAQIIGGLLVLVGAWYTAKIGARTSQHATDTTAEVQSRANEIDGMDRLVKNLADRLEKVEKRADDLEDQVRALEDQRARDHGVIRALWGYVQTLKNTLVANKIPVPEPPGALDLDQPLPY